jgi:hydrogenase maturation protease
MAGRRVVIGVGNEFRRDDGFGPRVVTELERRRDRDPRLAAVDLRACDGEPTRLLDGWAGAALAVVIDVTDAGDDRMGGWSEFVFTDAPPDDLVAEGTHQMALSTTVSLARALDRLPARLVVLVAHGHEFGFGLGLTGAVAAAVNPVADRVCELVAPWP